VSSKPVSAQWNQTKPPFGLPLVTENYKTAYGVGGDGGEAVEIESKAYFKATPDTKSADRALFCVAAPIVSCRLSSLGTGSLAPFLPTSYEALSGGAMGVVVDVRRLDNHGHG